MTLPLLLLLAALTSAHPASATESPAAGSPPAAALSGDGATILECYDIAVANLEKVCEDYRRIKALQLSRIRDIAFPDAYQNIQSVMPILRPINRELLRKRITDPQEISTHKREVEKVESEVENMVVLAIRLFTEIEVIRHEFVGEHVDVEIKPMTLEEIVESPDYDPDKIEVVVPSQIFDSPIMEELTSKAKENPEHRAVDLSAEMKALSEALRNTRERQEVKGSPLTAEEIAGTTFNRREMNYEVGRKVVSHGRVRAEWVFVDTWYTIGPFPNPQRVNLNTRFPPETVVNLSATYPGKNGKIVGWEFLQTNRAFCVPLHDEEYAIYYAYTELWFEEAMDLWVVIGSDDKANVWINNLPVWISGDQLKGWRIDEGMRKVHFQKGLNKILFRVENGWLGTAFSLGIQIVR